MNYAQEEIQIVSNILHSGKFTFDLSPIDKIALIVVSRSKGITVEQLKSKARHGKIVQLRQLAMHFIYELLPITTTEVGAYFNRDHSTVVDSVKKVKNSLFKNEPYQKMFKQIESDLKIEFNH